MATTQGAIGYANVFVSQLDRAVSFYQDQLGFELLSHEPDYGYASFQAGPISLGLASTDDPSLVGRHTGIGVMVEDIDESYAALNAAGVEFEMVPTQQPWGGTLALFKDPDGNVLYLDPGFDHE